MPKLFLSTSGRFLRLIWLSLTRSPSGRGLPSLRRLLLMLAFLPLFGLAQLIHWIGFLLDELLFPGYRKVKIREPLHVLGVPRSGTTHLHRVLARDAQFTTFSTWECFFALSVTERKLILGLAWIDGKIGRPLARLLNWVETRAFGALEGIHRVTLDAPEEDYFALTPILACFILVLPFPMSQLTWHMGSFDRDMPEPERKRILDFYEFALKRHLYVHGEDKRLLSKNAAFASLAHALVERFPDARFIVCLREPMETVPSQLSSIDGGLALFDLSSAKPLIHERLTEQLAFYYINLHDALAGLPDNRRAWLQMPDLVGNLSGSISHAYDQLELDMDAAFARQVAELSERSRGYRSGHSYKLEQFGISEEQVRERFQTAYENYEFSGMLGGHFERPVTPERSRKGSPAT